MSFLQQLPSFNDIVARHVQTPADLGDYPEDLTLLRDSRELGHFARALPWGLPTRAMDLVSAQTPAFVAAPDPEPYLKFLVQSRPPLGNTQERAQPLRILTYNTALLDRAYLHTQVTMPQMEARRAVLCDRVLQTGCPVILLQELWDRPDILRLEDAARRHGYRLWTGTRARRSQHGLAIAIRQDQLGTGPEEFCEGLFDAQYPLEYAPGPGIRRGWLSWRFLHAPSQRHIHLFNTHFSAFPAFWRHRALQARQLGLRARQAPNSDLVIAGGDFNAGAYYPADTWQCPGGRLQAGHWRNATAWALIQHYGQLRDGVSASGLPDTAHTATDANSLYRHSYEGTEYPIRMDHLFIRDAWNQVRASHAERLFTDVLDFGTAGRFELSDHYGMALTLEGLQPRESAT